MKTFALFADRTARRLLYELCTVLGSKFVELIPLGGIKGEVATSAESGCYAAYYVLRALGYNKRWERYALTYEFDQSFHRS